MSEVLEDAIQILIEEGVLLPHRAYILKSEGAQYLLYVTDLEEIDAEENDELEEQEIEDIYSAFNDSVDLAIRKLLRDGWSRYFWFPLCFPSGVYVFLTEMQNPKSL